MAFFAASPSVRLRPPLDTRPFATVYDSGVPPSARAATCSFLMASVAAACAARVMACVVWLPPEMHVHGRCFDVLPQVTSTISHGMPSSSADARCTPLTDSEPKLPMPDCAPAAGRRA